MKNFFSKLVLPATALLLKFTFAQQPTTPHHPHGHHHGMHIHKTLHPHMHLHKKNYLNSIKVSGGLGTGTYFGDLCEKLECVILRPQLNAGANYRYDRRWLFRSELYYVRLAGRDKGDNIERNLSFYSNNLEWSVSAVYDILKFEPLYFRRSDVMPYLHAGFGLFWFNPRARLEGKSYNLRRVMTEGKRYSNITLALPFGGGLRFKVTDHLDICGEVGYRITFTDYIDDVSKKYVIKPAATLEEATIQQKLSDRSWERSKDNYNQYNMFYYQYAPNTEGVMVPSIEGQRKRGNSRRNDGYFFFMVKAEYTIKVTQQRGVNINRVYSPRFRTRRR
jgi:hypothetical protein